MKELTIEQKAKAYDGNYKVYTELINRLEDVKGAIKKQNYGIAIDILCNPYPVFQITTSSELKESEDERIRKEIVTFLTNELNGVAQLTPRTNQFETWIAWVNKREQKDKVKIGDEYKCVHAPRYTCFTSGNTYKVEDSFVASLISICSDCFELVTDEQKQTLQDGSSVGSGRPNWTMHPLKGEQKPAEWSEEDEEEANYIADFIENLIKKEKLVSKKTMIMEEMVDWLKSLRPQNQWKPSEEQLTALRVAIGDEQKSDCVKDLRTLYRDLKYFKYGKK